MKRIKLVEFEHDWGYQFWRIIKDDRVITLREAIKQGLAKVIEEKRIMGGFGRKYLIELVEDVDYLVMEAGSIDTHEKRIYTINELKESKWG